MEYGERGKYWTIEQFKRGEESRVHWLDFYNKFNVLAKEIQVDVLESERSKKKVEVKKVEGRLLREITVKIGLKRIDIQERITVEVLLDSEATELVISSEFAKKNKILSWRN